MSDICELRDLPADGAQVIHIHVMNIVVARDPCKGLYLLQRDI